MNFPASLAAYAYCGLRLSLAATLIWHGATKLPASGPLGDLPEPVHWLVAVSEVAAGILLIAGAFGRDVLTRLGAYIVIGVMIGAIVLVHAKNGFDVRNGGIEFRLLMLVTGNHLVAKGSSA